MEPTGLDTTGPGPQLGASRSARTPGDAVTSAETGAVVSSPRSPRRRTLLLIAAVWCVAAAIVLPRVIGESPSRADSPYYETFEDLEAASTLLVNGTITRQDRTVVDGDDMVAHTIAVIAATDGRTGHLDVLVPALPDGLEPTAEFVALRLDQTYVLALTPLDGRWQLTSATAQSAFPVSPGADTINLDASLMIGPTTARSLGLW